LALVTGAALTADPARAQDFTMKFATLRPAKALGANMSCTASNELVVRMFNWPENGIPAKKFVATRAEDSIA
jgi:hypothetical protein